MVGRCLCGLDLQRFEGARRVGHARRGIAGAHSKLATLLGDWGSRRGVGGRALRAGGKRSRAYSWSPA